MKKHQVCISIVALLAAISLSLAQAGQDKTGHVMTVPNDVKWGPAPPSLPSGAQFAVLEGDPAKAGEMYTIRLKAPEGFKIPPHWHPVDEHVTVLSGTVAIGMGEKFDEAAVREMPAGSFAIMPKGMRHFAWARSEVVLQVHGVGPFEINYVNPADDPRRKSASIK